MNPTARQLRRSAAGFAIIYFVVMGVFLLGVVSLAVDVGRVQLAAMQAQNAADAAALYAAEGIIDGTGASVRARAIAAAADNKVGGVIVVVNAPTDIAFGIWDPLSRTFTPVDPGAETSATAVQVTVHCTKARGRAIALSFGGMIGVQTVDVTKSAVATIGAVAGNTIPGKSCPWLAGMPYGSLVAGTNANPTPSYAPQNSPVEFSVTAGEELRFASAGGNTTWGDGATSVAGAGTAGCDGDDTFIAGQAACNGLNTSHIPLNAMVGVFLNDNAPSTSALVNGMDFSSATSRDFSVLTPNLKQVFFIGDGLNAGNVLQNFRVPAGATRLFIGTMDEKGWWWDNVGNLTFTAVHGRTASLVK